MRLGKEKKTDCVYLSPTFLMLLSRLMPYTIFTLKIFVGDEIVASLLVSG